MMSMSRSICTTQGHGEGLRWANMENYRPYPPLRLSQLQATNEGK